MTETPFIPPLLTDVPSLTPTETQTASVTPTETETPTLTLTPLEVATELVLPPVDVPSSLLDTPVGAAPLGTTTALRPEFTWAQISGADQYYLWVADTEGHVWDAWYAKDVVCVSGTCHVTLSFDLYANDFRWWLQAWSSAGGYSDWSAQHDFRVAVPPRPPVEFKVGHTGDVVTYEWRPVRGVSWYYLWVSSSSTGYVLDQWYNASICTSGWCTVSPVNNATPVPTPILHQAEAIHSWWVQGYNDAGGYGIWSSEQQFVYYNDTPTPTTTATATTTPTATTTSWDEYIDFTQTQCGFSIDNGTWSAGVGFQATTRHLFSQWGNDYYNFIQISRSTSSFTLMAYDLVYTYTAGFLDPNSGDATTGISANGENLVYALTPNHLNSPMTWTGTRTSVTSVGAYLIAGIRESAPGGSATITSAHFVGSGTNPFADCASIPTPTTTATATFTPTATPTRFEVCGHPLIGDPESTEEPICYIITPQPTPTASPTATATVTATFTPTWVPTTALDFNGQHSGLKAVMFWAIFNESGFDFVDSGSAVDNFDLGINRFSRFLFSAPYCSIGSGQGDNGAEPPPPVNPDQDWYIRHCPNDYRYMAAQTMINGFLNYERNEGINAVFEYAIRNFSGSIGNTNSTNALWGLDSQCGSATSYKIEFDESNRSNSYAPAINWLNSYMQCVGNSTNTGSGIRRANRAYQHTILPQIQLAVDSFYHYATDYTDGAFQAKVVNFSQQILVTCVGGCYIQSKEGIQYTYQTPSDIFLGFATPLNDITQEDVNAGYQRHMTQISPYYPAYHSVAQPVLIYAADSQNNLLGYTWETEVYQQVPDMIHVPR